MTLRSLGERRIDSWANDEPWLLHPDGSGFTLAKRAPDDASDRAERWRVSRQQGGTPGADNGFDPQAAPVVRVLVAEDAEWAMEPWAGSLLHVGQRGR